MFFHDGHLFAAEGYSSIIDKLWQGVLWKFMKNFIWRPVIDFSAGIRIAPLSGINYNKYNKIGVSEGEMLCSISKKKPF